MAIRELVALVEGTPQLAAPTASDEGVLVGSASIAKGTTLAASSGNVGIGIAHLSADGKLHVHTATAGGVTANAVADDLVVENNTNGGISVLGPNASDQNLFFGSPGSNAAFVIDWNFDGALARLRANKVGATFQFRADANVVNLTLEGASGSETAVFAGTVTATDGLTVPGGDLTISVGLLFKSATDSITAGTTQTQAGATALTTDINRITVCANIADVVGLPSAIVGASCKIIHDGAQNAGVFPKISGNNIDSAAANAVDPNALVAGTTKVYACVTAGTWETAS